MAVATVDEYLSALEKSKLLAAEQLAQAQSLAGESSDAAALAKSLARENLISRWQAAKLLDMGSRAQLRLGKYKLIGPLGKGGMGAVFLAEHVTMNRRVALKIVPRAIADDRAALDRFFSEARAIAALDHPNIVQAYSVDNEMDRYFIVMEYVDGQDLQQMVEAGGPLEFNRAADYIRQAAEGLAHAHARNLVHCDVKPSNLLVNHQGVIKILDLGLARMNQSDDPRGAAAGEPAFGTVDYMAPEQGLGAHDFDHRADIYSLGCTLYYLLTGHPPFPEGSIAQRIVKHQVQEPHDILAERPGTPQKLVDICKRMMMKQPEDRYQSIQEVSAALAPLLGLTAGGNVPAPRAVKAIAEAAPIKNGVPDDWLSVLTRPSASAAASNGTTAAVGRSGAMRAAGKSDKQAKSHTPAAAAGFAGFCKAKLAWFNTTKRKVIGAIFAAVAFVAVTALAALPLLLSQPKPSVAPQAKSDTAKGTAGAAASSSEPAPVKRPSIEEMMSQAKVEQKLDATKPSASATKPPEAPKAESPKTETHKADVEPETKPPATPPVKPDVKPAPPTEKPAPAPAEVAKQVALEGLVAAVDLPATNKESQGVALGKLEAGARPDLEIQLLGGETIARGNPKFTVRKEPGQKEPGQKELGNSPAWSIVMTEKNKDDAKIARVYLEGGDCKMQWTADAKEKASLVRFCGLQFVSGGKKHFTALIAPKTVPPLVIDMETANPRPRRLSRDFGLCDPSFLRLQILPLDKSMPKHEIKIAEKPHGGHSRGKSEETATGDTVGVKGHVYVLLTKEHAPRIAFSIGFDALGKNVALEMQGACEIANQKLPLNDRELEGINARVNAFLMMNDGKNGRKPTASAEQIQLFKKAKDELKSLSDLAGELNQKGTIPFRVYSVAGAADDNAAPKIVIFESGQLETPKTPEKKKKGTRQKGKNLPDADDLLTP